MPGKQDGPGLIIYGPPRAARIAKNANFVILWPICETLVVIFSLIIRMSATLKFSFTWVRREDPPPKYDFFFLFLHILGLNLKISYQITSLFDMYIDMGEMIAGKQDRPSLIIEIPSGPPK